MKCILFRSRRNKQWYFHFRAANGKVVCASEGYTRKAAAQATAKMIMLMGDVVPVIIERER